MFRQIRKFFRFRLDALASTCRAGIRTPGRSNDCGLGLMPQVDPAYSAYRQAVEGELA
jgi:hypothetical protein